MPEENPDRSDTEAYIRRLERRAARERAARISAEEYLERKTREVYETSRELERLNEGLERRVRIRTAELENERRRAVMLSQRDFLTQLANRHLFASEIREAVSRAAGFALVLVDLDGFKNVNDVYGHQAGDEVLRVTSRRFSEIVRSDDLVARMGGDEFAVLLFNITGRRQVDIICERLLTSLEAPMRYESNQLKVGASLGVSYFPDHSRDPAELQNFADLALYRSKNAEPAKAITFEPFMAEEHRLRKCMCADLEKALHHDEIEVHYQPVVDFATGARRGCEALMRWTHHQRGPICPVETLGVAKESNLLTMLTRQVIRKSIAGAADALKRKDIDWMSVNLADYDLHDGELPDFILECCRKSGVDPNRLKIEITEHAVISDTEAARKVMDYLHRRGVHFAIDDFGTGYSNLLTLNNLPFQTLKIDQTFVSELILSEETRTIVRAMTDLAHALGLTVVAEGVETIQQGEILKAFGCEYGQGFIFGHPEPFVTEAGGIVEEEAAVSSVSGAVA